MHISGHYYSGRVYGNSSATFTDSLNYYHTGSGGNPVYWLTVDGDVNFSVNPSQTGWNVSGQVRLITSGHSEYSEHMIKATLSVYNSSNKLLGSTMVSWKTSLFSSSGGVTAYYDLANKEIISSDRSEKQLKVELKLDLTDWVALDYLKPGGLWYEIPNIIINYVSSGKINVTVEELPPLIQVPVLGSITNDNKYNRQNGISASTNSVSISWKLSSGDAPTKCEYNIGNGWVQTSNLYSQTISNLSPGTSYTVQIRGSNAAGTSGTISITIRTRYSVPSTVLSLKSRDLETLTFDWTSDKDLESTEYKIDTGSWTNLGQSGKSGSFIVKWFDPKTTHTIYFRGISTSAYDSLQSAEKSANGTTLDRAHITNIGDCIFGLNIPIVIESESSKPLSLQIWTTGNSRNPIFTFNNISNKSFTYTFSPTQQQLDDMYKCYTNTNDIPIYFLLTTNGDNKNWNDTQKNKTLQLTGIAKTAHIGINNSPRRAQVFIGDENKKPRRSVAWVGVSDIARRCI